LKNIKADDALYADLAEPIAVLKNWDYYAKENSVASSWLTNGLLDPIIGKRTATKGN
jgi:hypothetical protein